MANEKRLIDANAFECVCVNGKSDDFCNGVLYVLDMIDAQPTVEAVEVVRCKDCKYCEMCYPEKQLDKEATQAWLCKKYKRWTKPDDFCSYGERREGE